MDLKAMEGFAGRLALPEQANPIIQLKRLSRPRRHVLFAVFVALLIVVVHTLQIPFYPTPHASGRHRSHLSPDDELDLRLDEFRSRPVLDHDHGRVISRGNCPLGTYGREEWFFHPMVWNDWPSVDPTRIRMIRQRILERVANLRSQGVPLTWNSSLSTPGRERGVIYSGASGGPIERIKLSLHMLKNVLKSKLPVEVFYFEGEELGEWDVQLEMRERFGEDVTFHQVQGKHGQSFQIKHAAFVQTSFTEFVWMDSDNLPLADPADLFETVEYKSSGSAFWSDVSKDHPDNAVFRVLGIPCNDDHWTAETGQMVFDKRGNDGLNLAVLHLAEGMMGDAEWGKFGWGDKDTFRYAFYMLGLPYQIAPRVFTAVGDFKYDNQGKRTGFCGHASLHYGLTPLPTRSNPHPTPRPAFLHYNVAKYDSSLRAPELFPYFRRPRFDSSSDPALLETPSFFTGCLEYQYFGYDPQGLLGGQGLVEGAFEEAWGELSEKDWKVVWAVKNVTEGMAEIH